MTLLSTILLYTTLTHDTYSVFKHDIYTTLTHDIYSVFTHDIQIVLRLLRLKLFYLMSVIIIHNMYLKFYTLQIYIFNLKKTQAFLHMIHTL